jgi:hypothetical protein
MWLIQLNAILTKDNLARRKWQGDKRCSFCNEEESTVHLFFECYLARYIWNLITWVIGGNCRPSNLSQYWDWSNMFLQLIKKFIWWGSQLSTGLCGKPATWCVLKGNVSDLLLRSYV